MHAAIAAPRADPLQARTTRSSPQAASAMHAMNARFAASTGLAVRRNVGAKYGSVPRPSVL